MRNYQAECFYPDVDSSLISNFNHHITVPRDCTHGYLFVANFDNPILTGLCFTRSFSVGIKFSSELIKIHYHFLLVFSESPSWQMNGIFVLLCTAISCSYLSRIYYESTLHHEHPASVKRCVSKPVDTWFVFGLYHNYFSNGPSINNR